MIGQHLTTFLLHLKISDNQPMCYVISTNIHSDKKPRCVNLQEDVRRSYDRSLTFL